MNPEELLPLAPHRGHAVSRQGKRVTATPVVRHGLASTDQVYVSIMDRPERAIFHRVRSQLRKEMAPEGVLEAMLLEHLVVSHFRMLRLFAIDYLVTNQAVRQHERSGGPIIGMLELDRLKKLTEYERQIERTFRLSLEKFEKLRAARLMSAQAADSVAIANAEQVTPDAAPSPPTPE